MSTLPTFSRTSRLGFHYLPDLNHFRISDLEFWIDELQQLGAAWLIVPAPLERAVPEEFLRLILKSGIQPVLHFKSRIDAFIDKATLNLLLQQYARWGIQHAIFYDRPNIRLSWSAAAWSQAELVDRFLDKYIPCAELAMEYAITPIFPGLEPGGDYWDLSFLRSALTSILRRGKEDLLDHLALGAYATVTNQPVDWGSGGPERWTEGKPYFRIPEIEDHRGFFIYEWYSSIVSEILDHTFPVMLFEVGYQATIRTEEAMNQESLSAANNLILLKRVLGNNLGGSQQDLPADVMACFFCLVAPDSKAFPYGLGWYLSEGRPRPVVDAAKRWIIGQRHSPAHVVQVESSAKTDAVEPADVDSPTVNDKESKSDKLDLPPAIINHYVLLPLYAWGAAEWDFELIAPILHNSHPTVGFSLNEASQAERVTVVGGPGVVTDEALDMLRNAGCTIERLLEDGTIIAT